METLEMFTPILVNSKNYFNMKYWPQNMKGIVFITD